ncbi:SGNH/GDSL hydrolase family protein [Methylobacterium flocculans]|uniref:SGNH/GDSL hydrolase family protein n=1 Tax=Methylobacterium flocculans TaxID=2984843 RepID=UPI0021F2C2B7|nr:hypothetical protein [Methylobacterium sp. FF17]
MAENGIRTPNVPLGALIEVLGHADAGGGTRVLARASVSALADAVRDVVSGDPSGIASLRRELNALANVVGGKQGAFDLSALQASIAAAIAAVDGKASRSELTDLLQRILRINAGLYPALRPGDNPSAFSGSFDKGNPDDLAPLSDVAYPLQVVDDGLGRDLFATREIWERALHPVGGGELWRARWNYRRRVNPTDPSNDSVQRFVFWYGPDRSPLSATEVGSEAPSIASGSRAFSQIIGSNLAIEGALEPPPGAAYFRIGIRAYGLEQRTTVTDLGAVEITDAFQLLLGLIPPDSVPALAAALSEEVRRATGVEEALRLYAQAVNSKADALRFEVNDATDTLGFDSLSARFDAVTGTAKRGADGVDVLSPGQGRRLRPYLGRRRSLIDGNVEATGAYQALSIPIVVDRPMIPPYAFRVYIPGMSGLARLALLINRGTVANAQDNGFTGVGALQNDYLNRYPIADVADDATFDGAQSATFVLGADAPTLLPGVAYFFVVTGDGSNIAWANAAVPPAGSTPLQRGFFQVNGGWAPVGPSIAIAYDFFESVSVPQKETLTPKLLALTEDKPSVPYWPNLAYPLQKLTIEIAGQPIVIPAQTLNFVTPGTNGVAAYTTYLGAGNYTLNHRGIVAGSETVTLNGSARVRDTDYTIDYVLGTIRSLKSGLTGNPSITYTAALERLDYVVVDSETGTLSIVRGTERGADTVEYPPAVPLNAMLLYAAHVTTTSVEVTRAGWYHKNIRVGRSTEALDWVFQAKQELAPILGAMRRRASLRVLGDGDSTEAQGNGNGDTEWYNPFSPLRGILGYWDAGGLAADTLADRSILPLYDHGDGAGLYHTHIGTTWSVVEAIEEAGCFVTAGNLAIGGTDSSDTFTDRPNMRFPARIAAALSFKADLAIIRTGRNESGKRSTYGNLCDLITRHKKNVSLVYVIGMSTVPKRLASTTADRDAYTAHALQQAAKDAGAAYCPLHLLGNADDNYGGLIQPRRTTACQNRINHPGPAQSKREGAFAALPFIL